MANRTIELTLKARVDGLVNGLKTAQTAATNAGRDLDAFRKNNEEAWDQIGSASTKAGLALTAGAGMAMKAAMDWETAWAGVTKTVDGTEEEMAALESGLRDLATTLPSTHTEIAAVAEAAGQLGVAREDVLGFTRTMIDLGETTNLTADEAATNIAQISNVMGTLERDGAEGVERFASTLVALGNDGASTEAEILDMAQRIAGAGATLGATEGEVLALSNTLASMGIRAELGGGVTTRVLLRMRTAVDEGGESLAAFSEVAGVSAEEFAATFRSSPVEALDMVSKGINGVNEAGGNVTATLKEMGIKGTEETQVMLALASSGDLLVDSLELQGQAWSANAALAEEANKRYATAESRIAVSWNKIKDAAIDAGGAILPAVAGIAEAAGGLAESFGALPEPVKGGVGALAGIAGVSALALGGFITLVPKVSETVGAMRKLSKEAPRTATAIRRVGSAAGIASATMAALAIAGTIQQSFRDGVPSIEEYGQALMKVKDSAGALNEISYSPNAWSMGADIDSLGAALANINAGGLTGFGNSVNDVVKDLTGWKSQNHEVEESVQNLDRAMASAFGSGSMEEAAAGFRDAVEQGKEYGLTIEQVAESFPDYLDGIRSMAREQGLQLEGAALLDAALGNLPPGLSDVAEGSKDVAASGDDAADGVKAAGDAMAQSAEDAEELAKQIDAALDGLRDMGVVPRNAQAANDAYQQSLRDLNQALKDNGATLSENTEKGLANRAALREHTDAGLENAAAMAEAGASQGEISGALMDTYNSLVTTADAMGLSRGEAERYAKELLGLPTDLDINVKSEMDRKALEVAELTSGMLEQIPEGITVLSDMSDKAAQKAFKTAEAIKLIPGYKYVDVAVDDQGTPGQIQSRIDQITGVTEYVFVTDDGTVNVTQQKIKGIDGKTEYVYVTDNGTVVATQDSIKNIDGTSAHVNVTHNAAEVQAAINRITGKAVQVTATVQRTFKDVFSGAFPTGGYTGGVVGRDFGLPRYSKGGRLPSYGLGTDTILGIGSQGHPTAWVDDGEMVVRRSSTQKYGGVLDRINRDHPSVHHLAGYASGGRVGRDWSASSAPVGIDYERLAQAVGSRSGPMFAAGSIQVATQDPVLAAGVLKGDLEHEFASRRW